MIDDTYSVSVIDIGLMSCSVHELVVNTGIQIYIAEIMQRVCEMKLGELN